MYVHSKGGKVALLVTTRLQVWKEEEAGSDFVFDLHTRSPKAAEFKGNLPLFACSRLQALGKMFRILSAMFFSM